ncbi:MAG: Fructokinase [Alphaproteobacteria bacterium MarineAlpha5_Bin11]|nr:fructokinase [Pelagibacteraceae bacterium]PPR44332.1 MAG: Fructokinase [Alphaproteobacteria bacterium MarineAlpha5_Bin11]PPR51741.1 MAG: Fructokinase [Alphaproteobacteria bacterium MarineAlpha5_Bin10]|tara:strand:- start:11445 stop:12332 length:888 start_codon:yes stop_codon:yes gene_type:complete
MRIGIDLGGTKTEALLIDDKGNELFSKRIPSEQSYQGAINDIANLVNEIENKFSKVKSVGIGMPGAVSPETSLIKGANSTWINGKPFRSDLESKLKRSISLENDANCFALSEAVDGAGKDFQVVFGVIIGTGTGGGIVINKKIHKGKSLSAGEFGHNSLPRSNDNEIKLAKQCYCGLNGCIESFLSGPGFTYIYNKTHSTSLSTVEIVELSKKNDEKALQALESYVDRLARSLSDVINILDPDIVVLGGGMSNIDYIYKNINKVLQKYVFSNEGYTKVLKNVHGDSGGVRGAAWL